MKNKKKFVSKKEVQFLINSFFICGFISLAILLLIRPALPNKSSQDIAATISGILGTALGFFGSILVYKALIEQVNANKLIQKQFTIQQFESRLYKMLEIYNLHVSGLKHINRNTGKEYTGKNTFPALIYDFNELKKDIINFNAALEFNLNKIVSKNYKLTLKSLNNKVKIKDWVDSELAYIIFFYGVGISGRPNIKHLLKNKYKTEYLTYLLNYLSNKPVYYKAENLHIKENWEKLSLFAIVSNFDKPNSESFDRYYNGNQNNLGHYYRHLFMISRFINNQTVTSYLDKWEYSKLLRTQMSNHEQELFFINSISVLGRDWEIIQNEENNKLITKFDLLKNVSKGVRTKNKIEKYYPNVEFEDKPGETDYRKELEKNVYN